VSTWTLGRVFNAAFLQLDGVLVLAHNTHVRRSHHVQQQEAASGMPFSCKAEHFIHLAVTNSSRLPGSPRARAVWEALASKRGPVVLTLSPQLRKRRCQDRLNFRSNGPEDARLVQLGARRFVAMHNDYEQCAPGADADCVQQPSADGASGGQVVTPAFRRTMYVRDVRLVVGSGGVLEARASAAQLVRPDAAGPPLASVEKNWAPFTPWLPAEPEPTKLYFHRFLELRGRAIVQRLDLASGAIDATYASNVGRLRALIGCAPHAVVSGGTNGVRLNATHFVAIGHTMTAPCRLPEVAARGGKAAQDECSAKHNGWRAYALFACARTRAPLHRNPASAWAPTNHSATAAHALAPTPVQTPTPHARPRRALRVARCGQTSSAPSRRLRSKA
jgi:hypothetical protein